jgi:hypothetical protein
MHIGDWGGQRRKTEKEEGRCQQDGGGKSLGTSRLGLGSRLAALGLAVGELLAEGLGLGVAVYYCEVVRWDWLFPLTAAVYCFYPARCE